MMHRTLVIVALGAVLSACSSGQDAPSPDPVSSDEERALSLAAEMLDERPPEEDAVETAEPPGETAPQAPAP